MKGVVAVDVVMYSIHIRFVVRFIWFHLRFVFFVRSIIHLIS